MGDQRERKKLIGDLLLPAHTWKGDHRRCYISAGVNVGITIYTGLPFRPFLSGMVIQSLGGEVGDTYTTC